MSGVSMSDDEMRGLVHALDTHRSEDFRDPTVAVTSDFRKKMLRRIGWPEDTAVTVSETVFAHPLIVDDEIPADPGFEIRSVEL